MCTVYIFSVSVNRCVSYSRDTVPTTAATDQTFSVRGPLKEKRGKKAALTCGEDEQVANFAKDCLPAWFCSHNDSK